MTEGYAFLPHFLCIAIDSPLSLRDGPQVIDVAGFASLLFSIRTVIWGLRQPRGGARTASRSVLRERPDFRLASASVAIATTLEISVTLRSRLCQCHAVRSDACHSPGVVVYLNVYARGCGFVPNSFAAR
jgi:hypothetical protein